MEYVERTYLGVRSYSLPSVGWQNADGTAVKPHIEFGIKAEGEACRDLDKGMGRSAAALAGCGGGVEG